MQPVDTRLYTTQQHFMSDLYTQNPPDLSSLTIHELPQNEKKQKVIIGFEDPDEVKTLKLPKDIHDHLRKWSGDHEISSIILPEKRPKKVDSEKKKPSDDWSELSQDIAAQSAESSGLDPPQTR